MPKILVAISDFKEIQTIQPLLMKMGWDVKVVRKEILLRDEILRFSPEVILATAYSPGMCAAKISPLVSRPQGIPKWAMMIPAGETAENMLEGSVYDAVLEIPFDPVEGITCLAKLCGMDHEKVLDKYIRLFQASGSGSVSGDEGIVVSGKVSAAQDRDEKILVSSSSEDLTVVPVKGESFEESSNGRILLRDESRREKYSQFLKNIEPLPETPVFSKKRVEEEVKMIRREGSIGPNSENEISDEDLDTQRKEFVRALYKK